MRPAAVVVKLADPSPAAPAAEAAEFARALFLAALFFAFGSFGPRLRLRFLMTPVLRFAGRSTPCRLRNRPHALQSGLPSESRRHRGVLVVPQLRHLIGPPSASTFFEIVPLPAVGAGDEEDDVVSPDGAVEMSPVTSALPSSIVDGREMVFDREWTREAGADLALVEASVPTEPVLFARALLGRRAFFFSSVGRTDPSSDDGLTPQVEPGEPKGEAEALFSSCDGSTLAGAEPNMSSCCCERYGEGWYVAWK